MAPVLDLWTAPEEDTVEVELGLRVIVLMLGWVNVAAGVVDDAKVDCIGGLDSGAAEVDISGLNTANMPK